jgi:hypothetical protein
MIEAENEALKLLLEETREQLSRYIADFVTMRDALKSRGASLSLDADGRIQVSGV